MYISENYDYPSELQDSLQESQLIHNPSIRAVQLYQLDQDDHSQESLGRPDLESSLQSDGFLEMVQTEKGSHTFQETATHQQAAKERQLLLADRTNVDLVLLQTQGARETIVFTNITSSKIRMKFNECPFQIQNNQLLGFLLAEQLQIVIEPWDRAELTFAIEPQSSSFGDIIETAVVTSEFIGRAQSISPITIRFHVRYVSPILTLKYEGITEVLSLREGKLAVANLRANKMGEYELSLCLGEGLDKIEMSIESRGKVICSPQSLTLYKGQAQKLKLRPRGRISAASKSGVLLKASHSQLCYVLGLQLLP